MPQPAFRSRAADLDPAEHLARQAALQPFVDSAISKTINCPEQISFEAFRDVYAHAVKPKATTPRSGGKTGKGKATAEPKQDDGPLVEAPAVDSTNDVTDGGAE